MKVKKFVGRDFREALHSVKTELGRNAVILHTRSFKAGGVLGFWGRKMVEITASDDVTVRPRRPAAPAPEAPPARTITPKPYARVAAASAVAPARSVRLEDLAEEVSSVKQMVERLLSQRVTPDYGGFPEAVRGLFDELLEAEVSPQSVQELVRAVNGRLTGDDSRDVERVRSALAGEMAKRIKVCGPIRVSRGKPRVAALIGPTGVGKTTTIAKLAAAYKFRHMDVALVTLDSYRIAAVEQLRTYAEILEIPLTVVLTPAEFVEALRQYRSKDVVLVDTAGRSQRDRLKMDELRAFLDAGRPDEVHLVASATTTRRGLAEVVSRFVLLARDRLILTKVDEAATLGPVLDLLMPGGLALSYVTTGQRVPDDIEPAAPERLARLILGVDNIHA